MTARIQLPEGITGSCLWALGNLGGTATTAEVRKWLGQHGEKLSPAQARTCLQSLTRRKPPLAAQTRQGSSGWYGTPSLWQITDNGLDILSKTDR